MGFWFWFWIWLTLGLGALIALGFLAKSIFNRLESAAHQAMRLNDALSALSAELENRPKLESPQSNILDDPAVAVAKRRALQKARIKKQQQRQRRLIANLKHFDPNESRFH